MATARGSWLAALAACAVVVAATSARADEEDPEVKATTVQVCLVAHEAGQVAQRESRLVEAKKHFALCGAPTCPQAVRADCLVRRDDVERAVPTLLVSVRGADGRAVRDARVTLDGQPWVAAETVAAPVDPGEHALAVSVWGVTATKRFVLAAGEKDRRVMLTSAAADLSAPPRTTADAPSLLGPIVLAGGGLAAVVAGAIFQSAAGSARDEKDAAAATLANTRATLDDGSTNPVFTDTSAAFSSSSESATRSQTIAVLGFGVGGAALVGAVVWYVLERGHPSGSRALSPARGGFAIAF